MALRGTLHNLALTAATVARRVTPFLDHIEPGPHDVVVRDSVVGKEVSTSGRLIVLRQGCGMIARVEADAGVEVRGGLQADVITAGCIRIARGAWLAGQCAASSLVVDAGCEINGYFEIGRDRLAARRTSPPAK